MEISQSKNLNHFLTAPNCQFRGVGQGMKQTYLYLWHPKKAQRNRCDQRNLELFSERTSSIYQKVKLKDCASFFSFFLETPLHQVCLIRIKEQVDEKRSTVCTHRYAAVCWKNTSTNDNKYVVNLNLNHVDDISFRQLFGRIRVVLLTK